MSFPVIPLKLAFGTQHSYECDVRSLDQQKDPGLIRSRVVPGLNSVGLSVAVNQIVTNGEEVEEFLRDMRGTLPFALDANAPLELQGLCFRCKEYSVSYAGNTNGIVHHQFQATFMQTFRGVS